MHQQLFACRGETHAGAAAVQQRLPERALQPMHLHAVRRLGRPICRQAPLIEPARATTVKLRSKSEVEVGNGGHAAISFINIGMKQYQFA